MLRKEKEMKHLLNTRIILLAAATCFICSGLTSAREAVDLYSISAGTIKDPDIVSSMRIPVVDKEITLSARVRGKGKHPVDVRFTIESPGLDKVTVWAKPSLVQDKDGSYTDYEAVWKPSKTGFYDFKVVIDPYGKSSDSVTSNNSAAILLPVTWRNIELIPWGQQPYCKWVGTSVPVGMKGVGSKKNNAVLADDIAYWKRRGSRTLGFIYCRPRSQMEKTAEQMIEYFVEKADAYAEMGCDGLIIDETGSYPDEEGFEFIRRFGVACDKIHKKHPNLQVYNWIGGPMHREEVEIARRNGHILLAETYESFHHGTYGPTFPNFISNRVERIGNSWDHKKGLIALGVSGDCGRAFRPQFENNVRLCRKLGPEMPGICFYALPSLEKGESYEGSWPQFADFLAMKYFIKPVLVVRDNDIWLSDFDPAPKEDIALQLRIHNIGGMAARNVRVNCYARNVSSNKRTLLAKAVIPEIGNGSKALEKDTSTKKLKDHRMINGTKYPASSVKVFLNRALVDLSWKPKKAGYYKIEVELQSSDDYTILEGLAAKTIIVKK